VAGDPDRTYVDAVRELEVRPLLREYSALEAERGQEPDPDRKEALVRRAQALRADLQARFPDQWRKRAFTRPSESRARPRRPNAP
jgi:hypothetical protein